MKKSLPFITQEKRKGIGILLVWCIKKYQNIQSPVGKKLWYDRKEFLAQLQKQQTYDLLDKNEFNRIREIYLNDKNVK